MCAVWCGKLVEMHNVLRLQSNAGDMQYCGRKENTGVRHLLLAIRGPLDTAVTAARRCARPLQPHQRRSCWPAPLWAVSRWRIIFGGGAQVGGKRS